LGKGGFTISSTYLWLLDFTGYFLTHSLSLLEYKSDLEFKYLYFISLLVPAIHFTLFHLLV